MLFVLHFVCTVFLLMLVITLTSQVTSCIYYLRPNISLIFTKKMFILQHPVNREVIHISYRSPERHKPIIQLETDTTSYRMQLISQYRNVSRYLATFQSPILPAALPSHIRKNAPPDMLKSMSELATMRGRAYAAVLTPSNIWIDVF